jgi:hypothetical protein
LPGGTADLSLLIQFGYLQVLDILTTVAFLLNGAKEANPLVRAALEMGHSPWAVLITVKLVGLALAIYCVRKSRLKLLQRVNVFFAVLVTWNLIVVIVTAPVLQG